MGQRVDFSSYETRGLWIVRKILQGEGARSFIIRHVSEPTHSQTLDTSTSTHNSPSLRSFRARAAVTFSISAYNISVILLISLRVLIFLYPSFVRSLQLLRLLYLRRLQSRYPTRVHEIRARFLSLSIVNRDIPDAPLPLCSSSPF